MTRAAAQDKLQGQFGVSVGGDDTRAQPPEGVIHWGNTTAIHDLLPTWWVGSQVSQHTHSASDGIEIVLSKPFSPPPFYLFKKMNYS